MSPPLCESRLDAEGGEEQMQQARVVAVLHVLEIELPVVGKGLGKPSDHFNRPAQNPPDATADLVPKIFLDRRNVVAQAAEHETRECRHAQFSRAVILPTECPGHPSFAADTPLEC